MRESTSQDAITMPKGAERRRTPRLQVEGLLAGFLVDQKARMDIRDLSFGGFSAEVETVLEMDETYAVTFLPPIGENVVLKARVAYCKRLSGPDQPVRFYGGFEFRHVDPASRPAVTRLMGRVAAVLGFGRGRPTSRPA